MAKGESKGNAHPSGCSDGMTPGPWMLDETWMLIKGPRGEEVAAIHSAQHGDTDHVCRNAAHANARLIAAAPDLLEAAKALEETLTGLGWTSAAYPGGTVSHVLKLRAAIAKAEGR